MRIINEPAVTSLVAADKLLKDNPSTGVGAIAWSDFEAQIQALFLTNGKLSSSLVPSSFAGGISYKGTVAGASVPASSGATGDYYLISSAGTSQAITWAVGDFAVWSGAAWQQVAMNGAYTTPSDVAKLVNPRAPRQGLVFDGTAGATVANVPSFGSADFSLGAWIKPASLASNLGIAGGASGAPGWYLLSNGTLRVDKLGSVTGTASTTTVAVGKMAYVAYVRSGTTGTFYVNGVAAGSAADSANYTAAITSIGSDGSVAFNGSIAQPIVENRALSAAEVLALYESGAPAASDYNNAGVALTNGTFANSGYATLTGASGTGFAATYAGGGEADANSTISNLTVSPGRKYLISFSLTLTSGTAPYVGLAQFGTQWLTGSGASTSGQVRASAGSNAIIVTIRSVNATFASTAGVGFASTEATNYTVSGLSVTPLGLLCAPNMQAPGVGFTWNDQSGNGAHIVLPTSGVTWNVPTNTQFRVRGTTNTNGNQQLLGATVLPANCQITRVRARARTNTPTITIGTASGGSQIVASVAISTTWKDLTIALTGGIVSSNSSMWVGSNSTDVVEIDITAEPLAY